MLHESGIRELTKDMKKEMTRSSIHISLVYVAIYDTNIIKIDPTPSCTQIVSRGYERNKIQKGKTG